jgi:16S rRNA (cytosine967-C5)-methyltransferase
VKRSGFKSAAGFVNALLRKAIKDSDTILAGLDSDSSNHIAAKFSHPGWLIDKWIKQFGVEATKDLALANNQSPPTTFRFNHLKFDIEETQRRIAERGVEFAHGNLSPGAFRISQGSVGDLKNLADEGAIYFQDEASQLVASLVAAKPGERILDLCAAPGSKTTLLAANMKNEGHIIAGDLYGHRLAILKRTCAILGVRNVVPVALDAGHELPFADEVKFDRVLVDAPCSGTGTLRHNPEIKWRLTADQISDLSRLQAQILEIAAGRVRSGGRLVYSTCSMEREEDDDVAKQFLEKYPEFEPETPDNLNRTVITTEGFIRTLPNQQGCDGFFAAILRKSN